MNPSNSQPIMNEEVGFLSFDKITIDHLINFAVYKALAHSTENVERYALAVENIEVLISDQLEKDPTYEKDLKEKEEQLQKQYKKKRQDEAARELATFKLKLLMKKVKSKIPRKEVLEL